MHHLDVEVFAELSPRTFCTFRRKLSSLRRTVSRRQWLFLHTLDSVTTVRRLVEFYVQEHNRVLPHSAFRGQTPDEMYFGTGDAVPADLMSRAAAARRARASGGDCPGEVDRGRPKGISRPRMSRAPFTTRALSQGQTGRTVSGLR